MVEWWAARSGFPLAWDVSTGQGATVAVIDTGAETSHPELADRVLGTASFRLRRQRGDDRHRRARHPRRLAGLRRRQQRRRPRRRGPALPAADPQVRLQRLERGQGDRLRGRPRRRRDQHELRHRPRPRRPASPCATPSTTPSRTTWSWRRRRPTAPIAEQGYPANLLQPTGTGPDLAAGKGLSVTAADASDARASFAGQGSQISLAAYGAYDASPAATGPPGIFGAFTAGPNSSRPARSDCPRGHRAAVAPPSPATPATPTCRAPRWRRRWSRPTGALIRHLNPDLTAAEIVRLIKETARRRRRRAGRASWAGGSSTPAPR